MQKPGTPRKILLLAVEQGAHHDCLQADYPGACPMCRSLVAEALFSTYGHLDFIEAMMQILADLAEDERG